MRWLRGLSEPSSNNLLTSAGEDLYTKVEFSRRRLEAGIRAEPVNASILVAYRMSPSCRLCIYMGFERIPLYTVSMLESKSSSPC